MMAEIDLQLVDYNSDYLICMNIILDGLQEEKTSTMLQSSYLMAFCTQIGEYSWDYEETDWIPFLFWIIWDSYKQL